jgi:3'-5' exoribonuclease
MSETTFFAKIETKNTTTYDTDTIRVKAENNEGYTLRIPKHSMIDVNSVYQFTVEPIVFKEREQYLVKDFVPIDHVDLTLSQRQRLMDLFYEYAPVDSEFIKNIIETYLGKIENEIIKGLTNAFYQKFYDDFYLYPAATKFHHAYIGGLSYHTATMMQLSDGFIKVYPFLNRDLLTAGIFLHDILKIKELSNYAGPEYTVEGRLLGHITMAVKELEVEAQKLGVRNSEEVLLLEHMILSHHYYPNYGSPKKTNIPEALILHFIDNIDSKMTVLKETLDQTEIGEFTTPIGVLDREKYYKAKCSSVTKKD